MSKVNVLASAEKTSDDAAHPWRCDVAIVGAGPVGLATAGWLAQRSGTAGLSVVLIDARRAEAPLADPRALALSHGSRLLLETLQWPASAEAITRIHVSQRGHFGRALIEHDEHGVPALGYVARYDALVQALAGAVRRLGPQVVAGTRARPVARDAQGVELALTSSEGTRRLRAGIVVNAEGGITGAAVRTRDYGQSAIVGTVTVSRPAPHTAWERFTPDGPLALLPLGGPDYALVWCCAPREAERRMALGEGAFLAELQEAFGQRMGTCERIAARAAIPLALSLREHLRDARIVAIGNAAQTLHPVAGQGLNLGLRDAHTLVDALARQGATPAALDAFAALRRVDRRVTVSATDLLARAFTPGAPPLPWLRGMALAGLDLVPPVKRALARQMMFGQRY
jgi:2-octaprenyl-6-methoxyphenol hydroxylase